MALRCGAGPEGPRGEPLRASPPFGGGLRGAGAGLAWAGAGEVPAEPPGREALCRRWGEEDAGPACRLRAARGRACCHDGPAEWAALRGAAEPGLDPELSCAWLGYAP